MRHLRLLSLHKHSKDSIDNQNLELPSLPFIRIVRNMTKLLSYPQIIDQMIEMKYYHVFIQSLEKKGLYRQGISFDHSKENMMECIVSPFNEKKPFQFGGRLVDLKKIDRILIFESNRPGSKIVLPNGESPMDADMPYIIHSFCEDRVKGVHECTPEFILQSKNKEDSKGTSQKK
jgi:hypothetical protein